MDEKWISAEINPPVKGHYLAYHFYMDYVVISYWDGNKWEHEGGYVTHWMELPEKPINAIEVYTRMGYGMSITTSSTDIEIDKETK
jgi:hypothetical protein